MSTIVYSLCDEEAVAQHVCNPCDTGEEGRVSSLAAIEKSYIATLLADPENETVWATGITTGKIIIIPDVRGAISSTGKYETGYGRTPETYTGRDFKLTATDPNWKNNHATYNALQISRKYHLAYCTATTLQISKNPATWKPDEPVTEELNSKRVWTLEVAFTQANFPIPTEIPEGIFTCFSLEA